MYNLLTNRTFVVPQQQYEHTIVFLLRALHMYEDGGTKTKTNHDRPKHPHSSIVFVPCRSTPSFARRLLIGLDWIGLADWTGGSVCSGRPVRRGRGRAAGVRAGARPGGVSERDVGLLVRAVPGRARGGASHHPHRQQVQTNSLTERKKENKILFSK